MKIDHLKRVRTKRKTVSNIDWKSIGKWVALVVILIIVLYASLSPLRVSGAKKYIESGDNLLKERKYISALVEYRKAEFLHLDENSSERIKVARESERDIAKLLPFYKEINEIDALNEIAKANAVPETVSDGVKSAKSYIENGRPDLAILAANTAVEMDQNYLDAWTYLGLANYYVMKDAEISADSREFYKAQAREAWKKALALDTTNQNVQGYLETIQ